MLPGQLNVEPTSLLFVWDDCALLDVVVGLNYKVGKLSGAMSVFLFCIFPHLNLVTYSETSSSRAFPNFILKIVTVNASITSPLCGKNTVISEK